MDVYTINYNTSLIQKHSYDNVANYQAFTREMDYLYGEWFDNLADAERELQEYAFDNGEPDYAE